MFLNTDLEPQVSVHDSNDSKGDLKANQAVHFLEIFEETVVRGNSSFSFERNVFYQALKSLSFLTVFRIHRIHVFLGLPDSIIKQKY